MTADSTHRKIGWVKESARERFNDIELTIMVSDVVVTNDRSAMAQRLAAAMNVSPEEVLASPQVLLGTIDEMVEDLQRRRDEFGLSYFVVVDSNMETLAPIVARLAGQ